MGGKERLQVLGQGIRAVRLAGEESAALGEDVKVVVARHPVPDPGQNQ
jgi:hypothetical protein